MLKRQPNFLVHTVMPPPPEESPNANPTPRVWNTAARAEISAPNCELHSPRTCSSWTTRDLLPPTVNSELGDSRAASVQDEGHTWALQPGFNHRFLFFSNKKMKAAAIHTPAGFPPWTILGQLLPAPLSCLGELRGQLSFCKIVTALCHGFTRETGRHGTDQIALDVFRAFMFPAMAELFSRLSSLWTAGRRRP